MIFTDINKSLENIDDYCYSLGNSSWLVEFTCKAPSSNATSWMRYDDVFVNQVSCNCDQGKCTKEKMDSDGDGVEDKMDRCKDSPKNSIVDKNGCTNDEFCRKIDVKDGKKRSSCIFADWRDNERKVNAKDCKVITEKIGKNYGANALSLTTRGAEAHASRV